MKLATTKRVCGVDVILADFVTTWQSSGNVQEVANAFGIPANRASNLASWLRKQGVNVKTFPRGKASGQYQIDVEGLNNLI